MCHERRGRLVGHRAAAEGGRPRGGRRDDEAVGRRQRHRLLFGQRRRRRPTASRSSSTSTIWCSTSATSSRANVVEPYVAAHAAGTTPNPCIECNRSVKFARLAERADLLGFDAIATGHHARVGVDRRRPVHDRTRRRPGEGPELRGAHARPGPAGAHDVPGRRPAEVAGPRAGRAASTCAPPTSPTARTCASSCRPAAGARRSSATGSRSIGRRVVDTSGARLGEVEAIELVTIGQRKGIGLPGGGPKRYVVDVDIARAGRHRRRRGRHAPARRRRPLADVGRRAGRAVDVLVQCSAHGDPRLATVRRDSRATPRRCASTGTSRSAGSRRARAWCSTTSTDTRVLGGGIAS